MPPITFFAQYILLHSHKERFLIHKSKAIFTSDNTCGVFLVILLTLSLLDFFFDWYKVLDLGNEF